MHEWRRDQEGQTGEFLGCSADLGKVLELLIEDPDLVKEIDAAVAETNASVSRAEAIKKYRILEADFTEDSGHLTPTLKVKRNVVVKDYEAEIEALYS